MKGSNSDIELQTIPNKWLTLTRAELVDCDQVGKIVWLLVVSVTQFSLELHIYCSCHCTVSLKNHLSFLKLCLLKSRNVLKDDWIISYVPLRNAVNLLSFKLTTWTCFICFWFFSIIIDFMKCDDVKYAQLFKNHLFVPIRIFFKLGRLCFDLFCHCGLINVC